MKITIDLVKLANILVFIKSIWYRLLSYIFLENVQIILQKRNMNGFLTYQQLHSFS